MFRDLTVVFQEAIEDHASANLDDGDYKEVTEEQYEMFVSKGWIYTVLKITLDKYNKRLDKIKESYKNEINGRNNARYLEYLKTTRKETMKRYYKITQKLN